MEGSWRGEAGCQVEEGIAGRRRGVLEEESDGRLEEHLGSLSKTSELILTM